MVAWSSYGLDSKDLMIFLVLEREPTLSNVAIAKEVGLSAESVRLRRHAMKEKGFLRPDRTVKEQVLGERQQSETEVSYDPAKLGLLRQHVLFIGVSDRKALNRLKQLCDNHPYTHYWTVSYGSNATLYAQFDIPPKIGPIMRELYDRLQDNGLFDRHEVIDALKRSQYHADFKRWDSREDKWTVDYDFKVSKEEHMSRLEPLWDFYIEHPNAPVDKTDLEDTNGLDSLDMKLLRELTVNAQPSIKFLGKVYEKDPTTISRRIKKLRERAVSRTILYYDRAVFDLTYPQIVFGEFDKDNGLGSDSLMGFINSGVMPFECRAVTDDNKYLLFSTSPPSYGPEFSEFFWEHSCSMSVFQLQLDAAFTYFFYHENFTGDGWRTDRDYVLDEPLQEIGQKE